MKAKILVPKFAASVGPWRHLEDGVWSFWEFRVSVPRLLFERSCVRAPLPPVAIPDKRYPKPEISEDKCQICPNQGNIQLLEAQLKRDAKVCYARDEGEGRDRGAEEEVGALQREEAAQASKVPLPEDPWADDG